MTTTVRLLATYNGNPPQTIVRLPDALAATFVAQGNASLDLTGGINKAPPAVIHVDRGPARLIYSAAGTLLGLGDSQGNLLLNTAGATIPNGATVPGAPTGFTLTAAAGAVIGAFTVPASDGGAAIEWYEMTLSNGTVVRGDASPIAAAAPAGVSVSATVRAINGVGPSAATASASATPTGAAPSVPATAVALTGPTIATVGTASGAYTVSLSPTGGTVAPPVTVTPTPVTGVTFAPASVTLTTASPSATFTATATTAGTKAIAVTSTGGLAAPAAISLVVSTANVAPTVATQPAITGTPQQGVQMAITAATFNGTPTPTVTRTIKVAGVTVATGPQSSTNYTPIAADVGKVPTVEATATNTEGSVTTSVISGPAIIAAAVTPLPIAYGESNMQLYGSGEKAMLAEPNRIEAWIVNDTLGPMQLGESVEANYQKSRTVVAWIDLPIGKQAHITDTTGKRTIYLRSFSETPSAMSYDGTKVTVTVANTRIRTGMRIEVANAVPAGYLTGPLFPKTAIATQVDVNTFTYVPPAPPAVGSATSVGTIQANLIPTILKKAQP